MRREPWRATSPRRRPSTRTVVGVAGGITLTGGAVVVWDVHPVITTLATLIFGAAVTWFVAHLYYAWASQDLEISSHHLEQASIMILLALERAGLATLIRDKDGNIINVAIELRGEAKGEATTTADLTVGGLAPAEVPWWRFWERWGRT